MSGSLEEMKKGHEKDAEEIKKKEAEVKNMEEELAEINEQIKVLQNKKSGLEQKIRQEKGH
jgi:septal ring factor EnvC (AmiA/AmiB activator)